MSKTLDEIFEITNELRQWYGGLDSVELLDFAVKVHMAESLREAAHRLGKPKQIDIVRLKEFEAKALKIIQEKKAKK